jgi:hypothetical protein
VAIAAVLRNSAGQILAQASQAKAMSVTPLLSYALTTTANPVQRGQGIQFTVTVTNLSSASQIAWPQQRRFRRDHHVRKRDF